MNTYTKKNLKTMGIGILLICVAWLCTTEPVQARVKAINAVRSLKMNGTEYKSTIINGTGNDADYADLTLFSNDKNLKLSLGLNKGWKISGISYSPWKESMFYEEPGTKIKNKKAVKNGKFGGYYRISLTNKAKKATASLDVTVYTYKERSITYGSPSSGTELRLTTTGQAFDNYYCDRIYAFKYKRSSSSKIDHEDRNGGDNMLCTYTAYFNSKNDLVKKINQVYYNNSARIKSGRIVMRIRKLDSTANFKIKKGRGMKVSG